MKGYLLFCSLSGKQLKNQQDSVQMTWCLVTQCGVPLQILKEQLLGDKQHTVTIVLGYVAKTQERLHLACELAKESLSATQKRMK